MDFKRVVSSLVGMGVLGLLHFLFPAMAHGVPSFERQTGMECTTCHTVFPELKPFGRIFKLSGYTFSKSSKPYQFPPPVAGMVELSFTYTDKAQPYGSIDENWATHTTSFGNDVISVPQQASAFYGGKIYGPVGAFIQGTYDGASNEFFLDNTDIRAAGNTSLAGKNLTYGLTINNNPTVQDVWNTTPAWGFPFASSSVAPTPAASTVIDGTLASQVGGLGVYGFWNNLIYLEANVYRTVRNGITYPLGAGTTTTQAVSGAAPYWRLALQLHPKENHFLSVGTYGMYAKIFPEGLHHGPTDKFTDIAFDAEYQYTGKKNLLSVESTWIHERQEWDASFPLGITAKSSDTLNTFRINLNYYRMVPLGLMKMPGMNHAAFLGGTVAYFSTWGSRDVGLYAPAVLDGSRTGRPTNNGFILELDYLPWHKAKLSLQYTLYTKFNGARSNYDGFGRDASDNNTFYVLFWLML